METIYVKSECKPYQVQWTFSYKMISLLEKIYKASSLNIKNYLSDTSQVVKGFLHFLRVSENKVNVKYVKDL